MSDDTPDVYGSQQSPLSMLSAPMQSPEGRKWGVDYLNAHPQGVDTSGEEGLMADEVANANEARDALRAAREHLASQRMDPRVLGYNFAAAMLAPSKYGVGSQWSDAAKAMGDYVQQSHQLETQKALEDVPLAEKMSEINGRVLNARLALQELKERSQGQMIDTALKATASPMGGKPEFKQLQAPGGRTQNAWIDPATHTVTPVGAPFEKGGAGGPLSPETIQNAYDWFKQYGNFGPFEPKGMGASAQRMQMINAISALTKQNNDNVTDAALNAQAYKTRQKISNDYAPGGVEGKRAIAANTALEHLDSSYQLFQALNNHDMPAYNAVKNTVGKWLGRDAPVDANAARQLLMDEVNKVYVPGGGGEREREALKDTLSTNASPAQIDGPMSTYLTFLTGALRSSKFAYEQGLGKYDYDYKYLTPHTRKMMGLPLAPQGALDELAAHPEKKEQFRHTFGYVPGEDGF